MQVTELMRELDETKKILHLELLQICKQLNVSIRYCEELKGSAGKLVYYKCGDQPILNGAYIKILKKWKNEFAVLAHELGHYYELNKYGETTEQGANKEAYELCKSLINTRQQLLLKVSFECYFKVKIA